MATVSHEPSTYTPERPQWAEFLKIREMWASVAISMMWLAVLFDAIYGPNFVGNSNDGNSTTIPSAIFVAFFAFLASAAVAKRGFRQGVTIRRLDGAMRERSGRHSEHRRGGFPFGERLIVKRR